MKKILLRLSLLLLAAAQLHAQTFSTDVNITSSGTALPNLKVQGNGGVLFNGTGSTTGTIPATGAGTRLMWYPAKSAFRAGVVDGAQWNDANIGASSAAFGVNNQVTSQGGFASGNNNVVGGWWSAAFGGGNMLPDVSGTFVSGFSNLATNGNFCGFVAGNSNTVSKSIAVAIGEGNTSTGWGAMTIGRALTSASAGCVVVGMANQPIVGDATYWVGADPVFVVGNGTNNTALAGQSGPVTSNAFVVYKNGTVKIPKRQGDVGMGRFGNTNDQ
jgi:hypothetical protein